VITAKGEKKEGGVVEGKQENTKSTTGENNRLKKKQMPDNVFPNVVPSSRYTETV